MKSVRFLFLIILVPILFLTACENIANRTGVSIATNAYYTAFQKSPTSPWRQINYNNKTFTLETLSFTVDKESDPYSVVFVCPSSNSNLPHNIFVYYATAIEMSLMNFQCRKAPSEIAKRPLYGSIGGVDLATISNPQGEMVHVALSSTDSTNALEAYALQVPVGKRDIVAFKGKQSLNGNFVDKPETFFIQREVVPALSEKAEKANFGFGIPFTGFSAAFGSAQSSVTILGKNASDNIDVELNFLSANKSLLNLKKTDQEQFDFVPVPLVEYTGLHDGFPNNFEFNVNEVHELTAAVKASDGSVAREAKKFFTVSEAAVHELSLPAAINANPTLSLNSDGVFEYINTAWVEYADPASGETRLYRWIFEGEAAALSEDDETDVTISKVKWHVHVTPNWIKKISRTPGSYFMSLPTNFKSNVEVSGKAIDVWANDWSFKSGSPITWELTTFATTDEGSSGALIEYLLNRNVEENYSFSSAYLRSSISP